MGKNHMKGLGERERESPGKVYDEGRFRGLTVNKYIHKTDPKDQQDLYREVMSHFSFRV